MVVKWITTIDKEVLLSNRIIRKKTLWIKLLGDWELTAKIIVKVEKISNSARQAVEKAWGEIELITK